MKIERKHIFCDASPARRKFGQDYRRQIALEVCLTRDCPFRNRCSEYNAVPLSVEVEAVDEARRHGHAVTFVRQATLGGVR
ncbi:MAG: hypothetical protein K9M17_05465 [Mariprofundaceae bacterium]|nr:hypothetical protein [Mariprofundaceae bacterium]